MKKDSGKSGGKPAKAGSRKNAARPRKFIVFMNEEVFRLENENRIGTAASYRNACNSFTAYLGHLGRKDVSLRKVSAAPMADYQDWLLSTGLCKNTVACHTRNLRAAYNKAVGQGLLSIPLTGHPFAHVLTVPCPTVKRAASPDVIKQLSSLDIRTALIASGKDPKKKPFGKMLNDLTFARDTFLFCFFACGLPFVDFAYLTRDNLRDGRLCYQRHKTERPIEMEILPQMEAFISRYATRGHYLFPVLSSVSAAEAYKQLLLSAKNFSNHK